MFSSLPDYGCLTHQKASELLELIAPLEDTTVQRLALYVEHYIVTTPATNTTSSSSFLRRRFSSVSSRNKLKSTHRPSTSTNNSKAPNASHEPIENDVVRNVPPHIRNKDHKNFRPFALQPENFHLLFRSSKSQSSLPTSVIRSNSYSSDGSISKLSQPSSFMGLQGQDENLMSERFLSEVDDTLGSQHPSVVETYTYNALVPPSYSQRSEEFEYVGTFPTTVASSPPLPSPPPPKTLSETTSYHNVMQQPKQ
jgi:hypothetical protein